MSDDRDFEQDAAPRRHTNPYSGKHPIPTIQGYRQHRKELDGQMEDEEQAQRGPEDESRPKRAYHQAKAVFKDEEGTETGHEPYPSSNHNSADHPSQHAYDQSSADGEATQGEESTREGEEQQDGKKGKDGEEKSATEAAAGAVDPKQKRKVMKKSKRQGKGREVTDPVTHLPIVIHDQTDKDLKGVAENVAQPGDHPSTWTGPQGASKPEEELNIEKRKSQRVANGMQRVFPPPDFDDTKQELEAIYQKAIYAGFGAMSFLATIFFFPLSSSAEIFDDELWDSSRREEEAMIEDNEELPESVQWLNSLLSAIWPLVNPEMFASLVDMIEDVMQASLPKVVKMVSVDDIGQGSESFRILGVRWLPTGAASRSVKWDGELEDAEEKKQSDRNNLENSHGDSDGDGNGDAGGGPQQENEGTGTKQEEQEQTVINEGMEAEEGDFINLELTLAYRSRSTGKSIQAKAKNAHLYIKFYLPGGIAVPVWVELRGLILTTRLRLQLTPDPPFISLCTLTFLGQPKCSLSCVPLSKHGLNLMDVPLISSFVQSAIDAALAEYVAPKSLTLNLKDMLVGEDYKKDTTACGVLWIYIKKAEGFKQGDSGIGPMNGSSDAYVSVSWGKFGKPVASTRIIKEQDIPSWHEYVSILVTKEEIDAEEKVRLQLWDSDKWTADDDLGRVEVDLKSLMKNPETNNKVQDREDRFTGQDPDEKMPGTLQWAVGYFAKTRIAEKQLEQQTVNDDIKTKDQLKQHVSEAAERKLQEANKSPDDEELHQQKSQDYRELEDSMVISAPPLEEYPTGILSIKIHNITGLEIQKLQKEDKGDAGDHEDEAEQSEDLPDSYCTIIVNHKKVFRSRTKPKNSKPFFNAGTERFIRDWRTAEVIVSVRDSRDGEDDPLIGIVYLPLGKIFVNKSQVMDNYPLAGGIGYGRVRISMVWRSVDLKLPPNLLGWDYGTLEIRSPVKANGGLPKELSQHRIKIRTNLGRTKMKPGDSEGQWQHKGKSGPDDVFLPVRQRYSSPMVIEFRKSVVGPDRTEAFAVLWLQDLTDEEAETKTLKVWKGGKDNIKTASTCCEYAGTGDNEEPLGEVEVEVKFWRGLSGYHKGYAAHSGNIDMRNVMECLDTITDEKLDGDGAGDSNLHEEHNEEGATATGSNGEDDEETRKKLRVHTNDDHNNNSDYDSDTSSSSESDSDSEDVSPSGGLRKVRDKAREILRNPIEGTTHAASSVVAPGHNNADDGRRRTRDQIRDYKDHHKQLHRKHRGVMQWRVARQADHLGGKLGRLKGNVSGLFKHSDEKGGGGFDTEV
ncbi:hypothetical protein DL762_007471 [Monosporascus cannonballus]|uniref:C2 domain-containing protein n=1 Tax=Monosporascus cannonballus TaxID=155416 RepID=A0ABY0GZ17_9PEZI|nr:hypothetical protein DL762_007471 [Monosporascus cannonballus]